MSLRPLGRGLSVLHSFSCVEIFTVGRSFFFALHSGQLLSDKPHILFSFYPLGGVSAPVAHISAVPTAVSLYIFNLAS